MMIATILIVNNKQDENGGRLCLWHILANACDNDDDDDDDDYIEAADDDDDESRGASWRQAAPAFTQTSSHLTMIVFFLLGSILRKNLHKLCI